MDLTLLEGSSWLIKPFCLFVLSPEQKWGSTGCWQESRSIDRDVAVAFLGRTECSGSFADLATGLEQPHECLEWP